MPAVTVPDPLVLPRIRRPQLAAARQRPVNEVISAVHAVEGAGFEVWRPFPGQVSLQRSDPFLLLDQMGPVVNEPRTAKGAPWHPHRGFETVTYLLDGEITHHDSNGGGGTIGEGDTQWMTAGSGILHDEVPSQRSFNRGGRAHGVQLWVNLPAARKWVPPRYQALTADGLTLLSSEDGGTLVRVIAGELDGHAGPGSTYTPITYAHATLRPGAQLSTSWNPTFSAMAYVLTGQGFVGVEERPAAEHQLAIYGPGDAITLRAAERIEGDSDDLEVLLLGGLPIGEPIFHYGPFVMNTRAEIIQAVEDYQSGRMGTIPATTL